MRISIVVPCRNESRHISGLLDAVGAQTCPADEVVLVDSSSDDTRETVARYVEAHRELTVRIVPFDRASIPGAVNLGVREATGAVIVRLDGHSAPNPEYVARAVETLRRSDDVGVVGGVWRVRPGAETLAARGIALAVSHPMGAGDAVYRVADAHAAARDVDTVPFGCFQKSFWESVGGYNEDLLTNEDYEFNFRVRRSGRRVVLDPGMQSTYFARPTLGALATQYGRYGQWKMRMLRQYPESLRWRQAVPPAFVAAVILLVLTSPWLSGSAWLAAWLLTVYGVALAVAAGDACRRTGDWNAWFYVVAAFVAIHFCWGGAALLSLLTGGPTSPRARRD